MANLEAIGTSPQAGAVRSEAPAPARAREPNSTPPVDKAEPAVARAQTQRVELPSRAFSARLNYDRDAEEVVVEILDPETGDVVSQIPAEELPEDVRARLGNDGPFLVTFA